MGAQGNASKALATACGRQISRLRYAYRHQSQTSDMVWRAILISLATKYLYIFGYESCGSSSRLCKLRLVRRERAMHFGKGNRVREAMTWTVLTSFGFARAQGGETIKTRADIAHQAAEVSANKTR